MTFIKRTLCAFAAAAAAAAMVVLAPAPGLCVEEDPYVYRLLFASIYFEYETGTSDDSGRSTEHSAFQQVYTLDTLGNILSRRLLIYDAGMSYTLDEYEQEQTRIDTKNLNYHLRTTALPRSAIPLTLYGSKQTETIVTTTENERTRTIYGLQWFGRFRTLPETRLQIERQTDSSRSSETTTTKYSLDMSKRLGPTENFLYYNLNTSEDNFSSGNDSQSQSINFRNQTSLSRATRVDFGFARGDSSNDDPTSPDTYVNAITLGLQSTPSLQFNQTHRYTWYNMNSGRTDTENASYSGNMAYRFTDRLSSSLSLSASEATSESADKSETSTSVGTGFGLNYRLSRKLSLAESLSYSRTDTSSDSPTNLDRETFRALTHINYNDQFSWTSLASSLRLGYNYDKTTEELSGTGVETGATVALNNIDVTRYALFSTSADWSKVYNLTGDIWSDSRSFHASAANRLWRRFVVLSANYSRSSTESWISAIGSRTQKWSFNAASSYFRNTKIELLSEHTNTFDSVSGEMDIDAQSLMVTHNRYIAGGSMNAGFNYNLVSSTYEDGSSEFSSVSFFATYEKKLLYNLTWLAAASVSMGEGNDDTFKDITSVSNRLTYQLRRWLFSAEQKYVNTADQNRDLSEYTYIFRAMRQFAWFL